MALSMQVIPEKAWAVLEASVIPKMLWAVLVSVHNASEFWIVPLSHSQRSFVPGCVGDSRQILGCGWVSTSKEAPSCAAFVTLEESCTGSVSVTLEDSRLGLRIISFPAVYCREVIPRMLWFPKVKSWIHFLTGMSIGEFPGLQTF